jgi:CRP-like cAMP-binding protein
MLGEPSRILALLKSCPRKRKLGWMRLRKDKKIELLRRVPLFEQASNQELARVAAIATEVQFSQGIALVREGTRDDGFFILLKGEVDVRRKGRRLQTLRRGDFFGEIALLARSPRTATVTTGTPVDALRIDGKDFKRLLKASPTLSLKVLEEVADRLSTAVVR